ncbi:hypothetical protein PVAP13_9NG473300 [Panicum virgatum]|nr:hypothetical protein PVAP13_9NG473300 [Panicum virgatum]
MHNSIVSIADVLCVPSERRQGMAYTIKEIVRQSCEITVPVYQALKLDRLCSTAMLDQSQSEISSARLTGSYVEEVKVYGRVKEREQIIELITSEIPGGGLAVLPIVGNGGVGKTTLVQLIYNDARVENHFGLKLWICVSNKFDLVRLTNEMLDYVTEEEHTSVKDFNQLQKMLRTNTQGRRFLLVLDDVWDTEDKWELLLEPLKHNQAARSFIIVTTRSQSISRLVSTVGSFNLDPLEENDFWLLFKSNACGNEKYHMPRKLKAIGRQIANKLKGNPLAAKTVGALLRKTLSTEHWMNILDNEDWKSLERTDGIMPALRLSYSHLPCYLQQCFYWCALFPKDHRFHEIELVEMWISQGFVCNKQPSKRLDEIGSQYIADLVNFGFLQYERNRMCDSNPYFVMHDLMHDLACLVSANECVTLDGSGSKQILPGILHLSILCSPHSSDYELLLERIEKQLYKQRAVGKLRTLLLIGVCQCWFLRLFQTIFREAKRLRLVFLTGRFLCYGNRSCSDLDYSVSDILHPCHLRFLNLDIAQLNRPQRRSQPQDMSKFYSLQVLDGSYEVVCKNLCNIVNLRHLGRNQWAHASIPYVGKMTCLQELEKFKVQNTAGFDIGQLERLNELVLLRVSHLENIESETEALRARLADKIHLNTLSLSWHESGVISGLSSPASAQCVLEALEPHPNLKHLQITGYMGVMSPSWLAANLSVTSLQTIHLENCKEWLTPPPLGKMQLLKKLTLIRMHAFKEILIPSLDELVLIEMSKLESLFCPEEQQLPSCLRTLHLEKCRKLTTCLPLQKISDEEMDHCFRNLHRLTIRDCPHVMVSCHAATLHNTCYADIDGSSKPQEIYKNAIGPALVSDELRMQDEKILPLGIQKWMTDDKILTFGNQKWMLDDKILPFGHQKRRSAHMRECPNLIPLALSEVTIEDCPGFLSPHVTSDANANHEGDLTTVCFFLPYLKSLKIVRCGIVGRWISQMLSHAQSIFMVLLTDCPNVKLLQVVCPLEKEDDNNLTPLSECPAAAVTTPDDFVLQIPTQVCSSLGNLKISNCRDLVLGAGKGGFAAFKSLKVLEISGCPSLVASMFRENGNPFPLSLESLYMDHLPAEVRLGENMRSLKDLEIWNSPRLKSLQLHSSCTALQYLVIRNCDQLAVLGGLEFLKLDILEISVSPSWDRKLEDSGQTSFLLPPSLGNISVYGLTDKIQPCLPSFLPCLKRMWVHDSPNLTSLHLGSCTSLECLTVVNCGSLSSLEGLHHIKKLRELTVLDCPDLVPHLELMLQQPWCQDLCSQLYDLTIDDCSILTVPICKRLTSLNMLTVGSWFHCFGNRNNHIQRMVGLTVEQDRALQCLASLNMLQLENCPNLLHLPADIHSLPCLGIIYIINCPAISKLPEKGLPPSLTLLSAVGCSQGLNEQCIMAGKDKFKVSIDGEYV